MAGDSVTGFWAEGESVWHGRPAATSQPFVPFGVNDHRPGTAAVAWQLDAAAWGG
jgi:hypothetical protein